MIVPDEVVILAPDCVGSGVKWQIMGPDCVVLYRKPCPPWEVDGVFEHWPAGGTEHARGWEDDPVEVALHVIREGLFVGSDELHLAPRVSYEPFFDELSDRPDRFVPVEALKSRDLAAAVIGGPHPWVPNRYVWVRLRVFGEAGERPPDFRVSRTARGRSLWASWYRLESQANGRITARKG